MDSVIITLEGVITDSAWNTRPGIREFIEDLKNAGLKVYIWSSHGIDYAQKVYEMLSLPKADGFFLKGSIPVDLVDYAVDCNPSFMKRYEGSCIKEYNSLEEFTDAQSLSRIKTDIAEKFR